MNILRSTPALGIAAVAVLALTACSSGGGAGEPTDDAAITIAGVYENTQDPFWASFVCGAEEKAKELGVNLEVTSQPTQDSQKLATALDTALLSDPDGLILNAVDPAPWGTKVEQLMNEGIPVDTVQNWESIPTSLSYAQAEDNGGPFVDAVTDLVSGQTGTAVRLLGLASAPWQDNRLDAITAGLKEANPDMRWLDDQVDGFDVNKGTQIISSIITANPDLKVILAPAGPEGQAIAAAIRQTGVTGITVVAFDAVPAEVEAVRDGIIQILIAQPARSLGAGQVEALYDYLSSDAYTPGEAIEAQSLDPFLLPVGVLTADNVDSDEAQQYIYSSTC